MSGKVEKYELHVPALDDVAKILQEELKKHFEEVSVEVIQCPNLMENPFMLAGEGLCGKPTLADVGGVPNLVPLVQKEKIYSLADVAKHTEVESALVIGAGAGPWHHIGTNCEMMANIKFGDKIINDTYIAKLQEESPPLLMKLENSMDFCLLGNFFISEGKPGKVLKIHAKKRTSNDNFVSAMRKELASQFGTKPVGLGGVFLIKSGKAKLHIMPDFSKMPLTSDEDVNNWLKYFNMDSPLVCLSCFVTHDPGLDLRVEHTHCFSDHGQGGHYHTDTTPEDVEYLAYYNIAERIVRIDAPLATHGFGRD